jgi:hypothetical protein
MMDWYMKKFYRICLGTLLTLAIASLAQAATMYKWVDKDGHTHYSQQPPADSNYEKLNIRTQSPSGSSSGSQSGPTYSTPSDSSSGQASDVIKKEVAKGEEQRQKNCEQAKKALETYTAFRRVRDKDGNVVILDDNERAKRIEDAKAAIKEFCE